MKQLIYKIGIIFLFVALVLGLNSCNEEISEQDSTPIVVNKVYMEDAKSEISDREVGYARLGWLLRLEGSGFQGMRTIYVNGYETYFNPVFVSENSMLLKISTETPIVNADSTVRNTIRMVKLGTEYTYNFEIRDAAPSITRISHTLPQAGERITIYGSGLTEVDKVIFPGNVEVSSGIICDEDKGEFCTVAVPAGLTEGGCITIEGPNGGAYSMNYFNYASNVIINFDGVGEQGYWGWEETGSMLNGSDLQETVIGTGHTSQGKYCAHRPSRLESFAKGKNRQSECWTSGSGATDDWRAYFTDIPATTPISEVAFQFDIYVPNAWSNSGYLQLCLMNNFNGGEWSKECYNVVPWVVSSSVTPYSTAEWTTITVPFSQFYAFSDTENTYTFESVLAAREAAEWKNFGVIFNNGDFTLDGVEYESSIFSASVYTDNWRVVPYTQPEYSDFPTTEE